MGSGIALGVVVRCGGRFFHRGFFVPPSLRPTCGAATAVLLVAALLLLLLLLLLWFHFHG
jgi:hypothetical protein